MALLRPSSAVWRRSASLNERHWQAREQDFDSHSGSSVEQRLVLEQLHVRNFRSLEDLEIGPLSRINLVAGKNNAGKTTLLEAIFLLGNGGFPRVALNSHLVRLERDTALRASVSETVWTPLFFALETNRSLVISGHHSSAGTMKLTVELERAITTEIPRTEDGDSLVQNQSGERVLKFTYVDPVAGVVESEARETANEVKFRQPSTYIPFGGLILQPMRGSTKEDAARLGQLRKQKRGKLLLDALRVVEPRLQSIEVNPSSGEPMIWVDVGLSELVPLPIMGAGMTHVTRVVLAVATVPGGLVLVDEIENGLHHSVLLDVWRIVGKMAAQFNVQVFATTHSFECVEAAYEALGADGFRLHRLEVHDGVNRCMTYEPDAIEGAIRHNLEVR